MEENTTERDFRYTPVRRVYAWIGFITCLLAMVGIVSFFVWANGFIDANI